MNSQGWVTLALVVRVRLFGADHPTLFLVGRRIRPTRQTLRLRQLIESVRGNVRKRVSLIDAWFMRKSLILPLLEQRVRIIGQVRRDTALYLPPEPEPETPGGRNEKYGQRLDAAMLDTLPAQEMNLMLYGKLQRVRLRSAITVARFLKGVPVRAVWCEMRQDDNTWSRPRLILATETELSAQAVVEIYAERWGIEPLFHNLKRWWGVTNLWQQSKGALELWMQIRSTAYALTQLLALKLWESFPLMEIAPWRKGAMITAGLFGQWMRIQFIGLPVRHASPCAHSDNPKSGNFVMPFPIQDQRLQC
ncbi:MAG: transposase [Ferrovum myxofaciens]|nr:transposase [Ferrovum myxofaciens]